LRLGPELGLVLELVLGLVRGSVGVQGWQNVNRVGEFLGRVGFATLTPHGVNQLKTN